MDVWSFLSRELNVNYQTVQGYEKHKQVANMSIDGLVEVLVLLDELLDVVAAVGRVGGGRRRQEGLARAHPRLRLLAVAVEQLQLQVLVELHAARHPRSAEKY